MNPGQEFNPSRDACGFYPQDIVGRQTWLTDGQKRVYERLVRFAGRNGACFPSHDTLAHELGKSDRQVRRDVERLEETRLIAHRRNGRRSNHYTFLWHPIFEADRTSASGQDSEDHASTGRPRPNEQVNRTPASTQTPAQGSAEHGAGPVLVQPDTHVRSQSDTYGTSTGHIRQFDRTPTAYESIRKSEESISVKPHSDDSAVFRNSSEKPPEFVARVLPQHKTAHDRKRLAEVMAQMANRSDRPTDSDLDQVLAALGEHPINEFCLYLDRLPAKFQAGGTGAPETWGWFTSTARSYATQEAPQTPTAARCRHGKPWNTCCNHPAVEGWLADTIDPQGDISAPRPLEACR